MRLDRAGALVALKTICVIVAGTFLSVVVSTLLSFLIVPDLSAVLRNVLLANGHMDERARHATELLRYVASPLSGIVVGVFVGYFQRQRPALVAAICWIPLIAETVLASDLVRWLLIHAARTVISRIKFSDVLAVAASILAATIIAHLIKKQAMRRTATA